MSAPIEKTPSRAHGQPYASRERTSAAFAAHVNRGKVRALEAIGVDIVIGEREGARFQDAFSGRWYWNCHCNGGVFNLGHRNPRVVAAVRAGLDHLDVGNHHLVSGWRARLAEQLAASTGRRPPLRRLHAVGHRVGRPGLRLARATTGRRRWSPRSAPTTASAASRSPPATHAGSSRSATRPRASSTSPTTTSTRSAAAIDSDTAAVILESIPATLGFPAPAPGYLAEVADAARSAGALLILDEVQTGLGRHRQRLVLPAAGHRARHADHRQGARRRRLPGQRAAAARRSSRSSSTPNPFAYVSTFGGAEIGCVAASAVMDQIAEPGFLERVERLGERFERAFAGLPFELRRYGLTMGLDFDERAGRRARREAADRRRGLRRLRRARPLRHPVQAAADRHRGRGRRDRGRGRAPRSHERRGQALPDADLRELDERVERVLAAGEEEEPPGARLRRDLARPRLARRTIRGSPASGCPSSTRGRASRPTGGRSTTTWRSAAGRRGRGRRDADARRRARRRDRRRLRRPAGSRGGDAGAGDPAQRRPRRRPPARRRDRRRGRARRSPPRSASTPSSPTGPGRTADSPTSTSRRRCSGTSDGRSRLDLDPLAQAYPATLRPPLRRFVAPGILDGYRDLRKVYLDLTGNLLKERLGDWLPAFLAAANRHLDEPLTDRRRSPLLPLRRPPLGDPAVAAPARPRLAPADRPPLPVPAAGTDRALAGRGRMEFRSAEVVLTIGLLLVSAGLSRLAHGTVLGGAGG